jgi:glycosyltransferase involved in cell wall biosynthesis
MHILYIQASFVPPAANPQADRFELLSETLEGDVLQPVWFSKPEDVEAEFGPGSYPVYTRGRFRYHWFLCLQYQGVWQRLAIFRFYVRKSLELHRQRPLRCIVAYSHMTTGLMAGLVKLLTGAKLVIEIVTDPQKVYLTERPHPTFLERLNHLYSNVCLHLSLWIADRAHLLTPSQISGYPALRNVRKSVFHEFVPVSLVKRHLPSLEQEIYILLVGAPWFLKGADLLITAFHALAKDYPHVKLKILGYYPDGDQLRSLAGTSPQIEILKARPNPETLEIISAASILVQPSRCEGFGRVLLEGMAAGLPVIGADTGGIPFLIRDGENGFLIPYGDPQQIEVRLRQLLNDPALRQRMGEASYQRAHQEMNEAAYVQLFTRMVEDTVRGNPVRGKT